MTKSATCILDIKPMSLVVDLTSEEVKQIKQITHVDDYSAAVSLAAREYLRMTRLRELKAVSGVVEFCDVSQQLEALELDEIDFPR